METCVVASFLSFFVFVRHYHSSNIDLPASASASAAPAPVPTTKYYRLSVNLMNFKIRYYDVTMELFVSLVFSCCRNCSLLIIESRERERNMSYLLTAFQKPVSN